MAKYLGQVNDGSQQIVVINSNGSISPVVSAQRLSEFVVNHYMTEHRVPPVFYKRPEVLTGSGLGILVLAALIVFWKRSRA